MLTFRLQGGAYAPPDPLVITLQRRVVEVVYVDPPSVRHTSGGAWRDAPARETERASGYNASPTPVETTVAIAIEQANPVARTTADGWGTPTPTDRRTATGWQPAGPVHAPAAGSGWGSTQPRDQGTRPGWGTPRPTDGLRVRHRWRMPPAKDFGRSVRQRDTDRFGRPWTYLDALPPYIPNTRPLVFSFAGIPYPAPRAALVQFGLGRDLSARPTQPKDMGSSIVWGTPSRIDLQRRLRWGWGRPGDPPSVGIEYPDYTGPVYEIDPAVEPDILETYMIANSVSLVVLPGREPVDATGIKVARDIDAFAWTLSCELFGRTSLNLIRPDASGPKTVELTINGWVWLFLVERYSTQGKFPSERFTITGVSRTQLLAEPYAPKRSAVNAADINAVQAATDQLENTGFTLSWDYTALGPPDWTIPAGAFSYQQQTALQVIARVAEAVGGVVRPARDSDALAVVPRYRAAPWAWATEIMDRIIPAEIVGQWGGEWSPQPEWNSCYVSGTTHGVAVDVRRAGTAGDAPAPDVFDDLITGTDAARHRGIAEIAKGGNQEIVTLSLPLFPQGGSAPGLVDPAHLCEVRDIDGTWRGLCLSTEISAEGVGASRVTQTLKLERHH